jgi:enediyne biosynthesis protein E4
MRTLFIMVSAIAGALAVAAFTPAVPESGTHFTDITQRAGIHFRHNAGKAGRKFLPETMGSGVAIFDFNGDGKLDLLFINSRDWNSRGRRSPSALYRNDGNGKFTDVTAGSGLDLQMYGIGVSTADYDNDGREDVYVTALEGDHLFHNEGNGKFRDVTKIGILGPAPHGSTMTRTASPIYSSPIMFSGPKKAICGARWTARRNLIARPRLTRAPPASSTTT